jgi:probable HAF family extracellular repeat protein
MFDWRNSMKRTLPLGALVVLLLLIVGSTVSGNGVARYVVQDLGALPGDSSSAAMGLNELGQVVGWSNGPNGTRAFVYTDGAGMAELPPLPGQSAARARDINDAGQVSGASGVETTSSPMHAVRWTEGVPRDLGTLGTGLFSQGLVLNAYGQVVGYSYTDGGALSGIHAFSFTDGDGMTDLTPDSQSGYATAVNDLGRITGFVQSAFEGAHAFRWTDGVFEDLGVLPGFAESFGLAINTNGQVAGHCISATGNAERLFRFSNTTGLQDLGGVGEFNRAWGMNGRGDVVGEGRPSSGIKRAFLYTDQAGLLDLNTLIDPFSGWVLLAATDINDAGQIVGWAFNNLTQKMRAVRLTPAGTQSTPAAPSNLAVASVTADSVTVAWIDNSSDESAFEVERRTSGGVFTRVATTGANATAFRDARLPAATTYEYRVRAVNAAGASPYSNVVVATTLAADTVAPSVGFASPTEGSTVWGTVTVRVNASDNVGVTGLAVLVDGARTLCSTAASPLTCSWNTRRIVSGTHTLTARAVDAAGNVGSSTVRVNVRTR